MWELHEAISPVATTTIAASHLLNIEGTVTVEDHDAVTLNHLGATL
jgi:hypothetical protein